MNVRAFIFFQHIKCSSHWCIKRQNQRILLSNTAGDKIVLGPKCITLRIDIQTQKRREKGIATIEPRMSLSGKSFAQYQKYTSPTKFKTQLYTNQIVIKTAATTSTSAIRTEAQAFQ